MLSVPVGMLASLLCAAIQATPVVIENVRVVDVRAGEILEERAVLIRGGRIESVGESAKATTRFLSEGPRRGGARSRASRGDGHVLLPPTRRASASNERVVD